MVSDATLQLFTTPEFFVGVASGAVAFVVLLVIGFGRARPVGAGGLVLTGAIVAALSLTESIPVSVIVGIILLAVSGLVSSRALVLRFVAAAPGAAVIVYAVSQEGDSSLAVFVGVAIVIAAPLVASFDASYGDSSVPMSLFVIALLGVFITVPDTESAIVVVGVALPLALAGSPIRLATLGRYGALAASGLFVWLVYVGGFARPGSVVLGVATLGILIAEPAVRMVSHAGSTRLAQLLERGFGGDVLVLTVQVLIAFSMTAVVRRTGSSFDVSLAAAFVVLAFVGTWAGLPRSGGS